MGSENYRKKKHPSKLLFKMQHVLLHSHKNNLEDFRLTEINNASQPSTSPSCTPPESVSSRKLSLFTNVQEEVSNSDSNTYCTC